MRFTKTGSLKFIGHLDCMRFFQKAIRRAKLDVSYSNGFNPHQIMSFASPLSVGLTSDGEYIDIEFNSLPEMSKEELIRYINQYMTEELFVTEIHVLEETSKTSMALLNACDYMITLKDGTDFCHNTETAADFSLRETFGKFMEQEQITIRKKTKKSEQEIDLKPFILAYAFSKEAFEKLDGVAKLPELNHEYDSEEQLYLKLVSGSVTNIKPELVLEAYMKYLDTRMKPFSYQVHRIQMYFNPNTPKRAEGASDLTEKTSMRTEVFR